MNRRTFLLAALASAAAMPPIVRVSHASGSIPLRVVTRTLDIMGRSATVYGLIGPEGRTGLTLDAGTTFDVALQNTLPEETIIHWHGLTPPWDADGVAGAPRTLMGPKETRRFAFPVGDGGTHWMHAHTLQEQNLLAAPLIVRTAADRTADEQEVVVLLHDFSFKPATEILAGLTKGTTSNGATAGSGHGAMNHSGASGGSHTMPMTSAAMDLNDIDYDAYLANDRTLHDPEVSKVEPGGRVRLRLINGATSTAFTIDTGALDAEAIAVDGQLIEPVAGRLFPLSMGQRIDLRLTVPKAGGAFPILARREGAVEQAGIVLATSGAPVKRIPVAGAAKGPVLDLAFEAKLRAATPLAAEAQPRRFTVDLLGTMTGYKWGMQGDPILVRRGERAEITMRNQSMMAHPMHLHGHRFQVLAIDGKPLNGAVRDTVLIPPMRSVTIGVEAMNPGKWAFHCHHLYHMAAGMMATFAYEGVV